MILIRAAVQICSRDFRPCRMDIGRHGRILHSPGAFREHRERRTDFSGVQRLFLRIPASDQKQVAPENIAQ